MKRSLSVFFFLCFSSLLLAFPAFSSRLVSGSHAVSFDSGKAEADQAESGKMEESKAESGRMEKPEEKKEEEEEAKLLAATKTSEKTKQIILKLDHRLSLWNKEEDGRWKKVAEYYSGHGRNGFKKAEERREGDGTTPIGSFPILFSFGQGDKPETEMSYRRISRNSYWSSGRKDYNSWVESGKKIEGEHLIEYPICYQYAMAVGFNQNPAVFGRGSAIFLHIKAPDTWESSGCITLEKEALLELLRLCRDGCYILIVPDASSIGSY